MRLDEFAMCTASLAGPLEAKLQAMRDAGFTQVMLSAGDVVGHPEGFDAAVRAVRASGLRVTAFQALSDFEGLSGAPHDYKVGVAKSLIEMCAALGCRVLLALSSTSEHATTDRAALARDLRKLATLALPHQIRVAYSALSWGRTVNRYVDAWDLVLEADCSNLGIALDAFHLIEGDDTIEDLDLLDPLRIDLVLLSDFMWRQTPAAEERSTAARTFRVFPGEGVHGDEIAQLVLALDRLGYRGAYGFDAANDDYCQLPLPVVADRARRAATWLAEDVLQRLVPLPGAMRLRS
jgi:sugar phosphate isomerase/epimerase